MREPSFAAGLIYARCGENGFGPKWAEDVIEQAETFPKSKFRDLVDSTTQAVTWARKTGLIVHDHEAAAAYAEAAMHRPRARPLYDV